MFRYRIRSFLFGVLLILGVPPCDCAREAYPQTPLAQGPPSEASQPATVARNVANPCEPKPNEERVNYGGRWKAWSDTSRQIYLEGFTDGGGATFMAVWNDLPADRREPLGHQTATIYDDSALSDVITSLYGDPANTYIRFDAMVYIARDKLSGAEIEPTLRTARAYECGFTVK